LGLHATSLLRKLPLQVCNFPLHLCIARPLADALEAALDLAFEAQSLAAGASLEGFLDDIAPKLASQSAGTRSRRVRIATDLRPCPPIGQWLTFCWRHSLHALLTGCFLRSSWCPSSDASASGDATVPGELSSPASEAFLFRFDIPLVACLSLTGLPELWPAPPTPPPLPVPVWSATLAGRVASKRGILSADVNRPHFAC
jgi:hypothetical protein